MLIIPTFHIDSSSGFCLLKLNTGCFKKSHRFVGRWLSSDKLSCQPLRKQLVVASFFLVFYIQVLPIIPKIPTKKLHLMNLPMNCPIKSAMMSLYLDSSLKDDRFSFRDSQRSEALGEVDEGSIWTSFLCLQLVFSRNCIS